MSTASVDVLDQTGPADEWWERAVLAAVLQGYNDLPRLSRLINRDSYANPVNGFLWHLAVRLDADGIQPTVAMLLSRLGDAALRLPGGPPYLSDLFGMDGVIPAQAEHYAIELRRCALRRAAGVMGLRLSQLVHDLDSDPDLILARAQEWLDDIRDSQRGLLNQGPTALAQVIDTAERGETGAIPTAWSDIDSLIGGWYPGAVTVVAARPGVGKSLWGENAITHAVRNHGVHGLMVSLEMTEFEITQRTLSHTAQVTLTALRAGKHHLNERDWEAIQRAVPVLEADRDRLTIHAAGGQTMLDIKQAVIASLRRAHRADNRLGLVVVDYIGRVRATDPRLDKRIHLGQVIDEIKDLAVEHKFAAIVLAQLNRKSEDRADKRPALADVRDSGDIEQTADNVFLLHEEEVETQTGKKEKTGEVDAILAKQRNGPTGVRTLIKFGEYARLDQGTRLTPPTPLRVVKD